mmetsp:Transcript_15334/g.23358  ORF Transcript_15334/g.23358 Transcript_15334/m.23358 type:complete len:90 (+) Transcript_15334:310-579(+)
MVPFALMELSLSSPATVSQAVFVMMNPTPEILSDESLMGIVVLNHTSTNALGGERGERQQTQTNKPAKIKIRKQHMRAHTQQEHKTKHK